MDKADDNRCKQHMAFKEKNERTRDPSRRHRRLWRVLNPLASRFVRWKFALDAVPVETDGAVLLVSNHVSAWDPLIVSASLGRKQAYFVASEHLFRLGAVSRLIEWVVAPIPRRKASQGADAVKAMLRHLRAGHSVCLFAEGEQCWTGRSGPVFPATGKLAKSSGTTLVTYRIEGGYLSLPRWGRGVRRGRVKAHPVGVYPPERLKAMRPEEVNALIERDIREDAWLRQRRERVLYRGKNRAEGLERALCLCPACGRVGGLSTRKDRLTCRCGLSVGYGEDGFFDLDAPFPTLADWDDWQAERLRRRDFPYAADEEGLIFSDGGMRLSRVEEGHRDVRLGRGMLQLYEDRLVCAGHSFPLPRITSMAAVLSSRLLFSCSNQYYEIVAERGGNLRKYLLLWESRAPAQEGK